jgi:hypothetical protein
VALSPNDGETFLKEVDDELRREQINTFFTRYGWWIIGGAVAILAAVGGYLWWSSRQAAAREAAGETLVAAVSQLNSGTRGAAAARPQIDALAGNSIEGYRAAALFARATSQAQSGDNRAAVGTLRAIEGDEGLDQVYRDAALIRRTQLEFDGLQPQEVIRRLNAMATGDSGWAGAAGEMVGVAHLKMNRPDLAGPVFVRIARDQNAPETRRQRASMMAASLGLDPDPDAPRSTAPARPATPAATPTAPAATPAAPATAPATREKAR